MPTSHFKNSSRDHQWMRGWVSKVEETNGRSYEQIRVTTGLGVTQVYALNNHALSTETLLIFPGARTSALFWDFDAALDRVSPHVRIFLIETNGLPNLSDGTTPDIRSAGYGAWAHEMMDQLGIERAYIAGASFGGLICVKASIWNASRFKGVFLLNPGCLQPFSLKFSNLFYNMLPIVMPSAGTIKLFLEKAVFCRPEHQVSDAAYDLLVDYELFALRRYKDSTQKPYDMNDELTLLTNQVFLLVGDKDLLFPYKQSVSSAKAKIKNLRQILVFQNVAHGIETYPKAIQFIDDVICGKPL